jgi:hypothetical protein
VVDRRGWPVDQFSVIHWPDPHHVAAIGPSLRQCRLDRVHAVMG